MELFNKLVRDKIPQIIWEQGETPHTRILEQGEYTAHLEVKLDEEVQEFHAEKNLEELADILEVVYALASLHGCTKEELLAVYENKHEQRGGFEKRMLLIESERGN